MTVCRKTPTPKSPPDTGYGGLLTTGMTTRRKNSAAKKPPATDNRSLTTKFGRVFDRVYRLVLRIPPGRVMTYGQIARILEGRYSPRLVGWAMHATPHDERNIPWHRVINSRGAVSTGKIILHEPELQKLMLEAEGVMFDDRGRCDLAVYQWSPRKRSPKLLIKSGRKPSSQPAGRLTERTESPRKEAKRKKVR